MKTLRMALVLGLALAPAWATAADEATAQVRAAVEKLAPGTKIDTISPTAMPGMFQVAMGAEVLYVSGDGKYVFSGAMWDVGSGRNLTEDRQATYRRDVLNRFGPEQRFVFAAAEPKYKVTVVTALDCGYCRKLHEQVQAFNDVGITLEYLLLPRGGLDSPSYADSVSVYCAADRNNALTAAKRGEPIDAKTCPNPIRDEFIALQSLGIGTTPTVLAADGSLLGHYMTPGQMLGQLQARGAMAK